MNNALEFSISNKIDEDSKEYESSPNNTRTQVRSRTQKRRTTKEGYYTKLIKRNINRDESLEQWRNLNIHKIISASKMKSKDLGN